MFYIEFCVILTYNSHSGKGGLYEKAPSTAERGCNMPVKYKFDVLLALKEAGYNTTKLRKEKLLAEGVIQSLRDGKAISFQNLGRICDLLNCQPGDILEYEQEAGE